MEGKYKLVEWKLDEVIAMGEDPRIMAESIIKELGLDGGYLHYGRKTFQVKGARMSKADWRDLKLNQILDQEDPVGKVLEIYQTGEFDLYGGPYDPKMNRGQVIYDGEDITDQVEERIKKIWGNIRGNHYDLSQVDNWADILD